MKKLFFIGSMIIATSAFASDVDPFSFEKEHFNSTLSRAEVTARMKARQPVTGIRIDDQGRAITAPSTKTREQVVAETLEASRLGLLRYTELGAVQATAEQEKQVELAGLRAAGRSAAIE